MKTNHKTAESGPVRDAAPAELAERIYKASHYRAIRQLACQFEAGVLIISGRVPNYYLKQLAQTLIRNVDGIGQIVNQVHVTK